jgi:ADP-ribosylglycohydrolase
MGEELSFDVLVMAEAIQRRQEGCDADAISAIEADLDKLRGEGSPRAALEELYRRLDSLAPLPTFPYHEPTDLPGILAARPTIPVPAREPWHDDALLDRLHGAWLGRCAGCTLGKPVEGWPSGRIRAYLELARAFPLADYVPMVDAPKPDFELHPSHPTTTRGNIHRMARDDDLDYTCLGLHIAEMYSDSFTTENVGTEWLDHLPYRMTYTAERLAYRNLVNEMPVPRTASYRNPFREWIGAQIRADMWGYIAVGRPQLAAELAYRDATLSHVKNGVYGEMWVAAMIAAALVSDDPSLVIQAGLGQIPAASRLAEAVRDVVVWHGQHPDWETTWAKVQAKYGAYHWVHVISNAAAVVVALLYGGRDLAGSITIAVMAGGDTDCNGATVGSIVGAMLGARELPEAWIAPLNDRLASAIYGFSDCRISDLAQRTYAKVIAGRQEGLGKNQELRIGDCCLRP